MPRKFVPQGKLNLDRQALEDAFKYRVETGCSLRTACKQFNVKVMTLQDAFKRSHKLSDGKTFVPMQQNSQKVFSAEQEDHISAYCIKIAKMFDNLPMIEFRRMVYSYAVACQSKCIPSAWEQEKRATRDWYYSFMSRHPELKLKTQEGMSIGKVTAFSKSSVDIFFTAYTEAIEKYCVGPERIYNLDETCLLAMMKPVKDVCEKGATMTFVGIINAAGHYIPPVFIISRKIWNDSFMRGTLDGSKGILHQNGWMNGECFLETLKHVHAKTFCSVDNKIILIIDSAVCQLNIHAITYAIENGIVIIALPPHTTSMLQPLDVSVYGPFQMHLRSLQSDFSLVNPNIAMTEDMLPKFASDAWIKSATSSNILSGFSVTGIWPINRSILLDEALAEAEVTERPPFLDAIMEIPNSDPALDADLSFPLTPGPSGCSATITPEHISPLTNAGSRSHCKGRKKIHASILNENPEAIADMHAIEEKKTGGAKKLQSKKRKTVAQGDSSSVSSPEYSDEIGNLDVCEYPFAEKEVEEGEFVLVEHDVDGKRESSKDLFYDEEKLKLGEKNKCFVVDGIWRNPFVESHVKEEVWIDEIDIKEEIID